MCWESGMTKYTKKTDEIDTSEVYLHEKLGNILKKIEFTLKEEKVKV